MGFFFLLGVDDSILHGVLTKHTLVWCSTTQFLPTSLIATCMCLYVVTYMSYDIPHQHIPHPQHVWRCLLLFFFLLLEVEEDVHFTWKKPFICKNRVEIEISCIWCLLHVHFSLGVDKDVFCMWFFFLCAYKGRCILHVHFFIICRQRCFLHV